MYADCCPYCKGHDIDVRDTDSGNEKFYEYVYCMDCKGTWTQVYKFSHFEDVKEGVK